MVNEVVYDYLKKNLSRYTPTTLKPKVLSGGYSESEFNEALMKIQSEERKKQGNLRPSRQLFIAFIFSLLLVFFSLYFISVSLYEPLGSFLLHPTSLVYPFLFAIVFVLSVFYYFLGFSIVGKKTESTMIQRSSTFLFIFCFLLLACIIFLVFFGHVLSFSDRLIVEEGQSETTVQQMFLIGLPLYIHIAMGFFLFFSFCFSITFIFLSIGCIFARSKASFLLISGITRLLFSLVLFFSVCFFIFMSIRSFMDPLFLSNVIASLETLSVENIYLTLFLVLFALSMFFDCFALFFVYKRL